MDLNLKKVLNEVMSEQYNIEALLSLDEMAIVGRSQ